MSVVAILIRIVEALFLIGIAGSAVVAIWVFAEEASAIGESDESVHSEIVPPEIQKAS